MRAAVHVGLGLLPALRVGSQQIASRMATAEQESAAADVAQLEVAFESLGMEPPKKEEVAELQEDAKIDKERVAVGPFSNQLHARKLTEVCRRPRLRQRRARSQRAWARSRRLKIRCSNQDVTRKLTEVSRRPGIRQTRARSRSAWARPSV